MCLWAFYRDHKRTLSKVCEPVVECAFSWRASVYLLFSANTVTGKNTWSHPALAAWGDKLIQKGTLLKIKWQWRFTKNFKPI